MKSWYITQQIFNTGFYLAIIALIAFVLMVLIFWKIVGKLDEK